MKIYSYTFAHYKTGEPFCWTYRPNYRHRNKILVNEATEDTEAVYRDETDDEILQRAIDSLPSDAQHITVIDDTDLPYSGYRPELRTRSVAMRNSWVNPPDTTSPPLVDMVKAREGKMAEWRKKRADMFDVLDKQMQFADEIANQSEAQQRKSAIVRDKVMLRDFPVTYADRIAGFTDPKELDDFDPIIDIIISMESV